MADKLLQYDNTIAELMFKLKDIKKQEAALERELLLKSLADKLSVFDVEYSDLEDFFKESESEIKPVLKKETKSFKEKTATVKGKITERVNELIDANFYDDDGDFTLEGYGSVKLKKIKKFKDDNEIDKALLYAFNNRWFECFKFDIDAYLEKAETEEDAPKVNYDFTLEPSITLSR